VNAVTVDDIQRVARAYLRPDRLSMVLVGDAKAFTSQLAGVGFGQFEAVELGDLDLTTANFKRGGTRVGGAGEVGWAGAQASEPVDVEAVAQAFRPASAPQGSPKGLRYADPLGYQTTSITPQEGEKARLLLDRAIAAKGGLDKLRGVRTIVARQRLSNPAVEGQSTETTNYIQYPDRFRVEIQLPDGTVVQAYDGAQAWMKDGRGTREAPELVREARASLRRDTISLLLAAKDGSLTPRVLPDVKDGAGDVHHALELSGKDFNPVILYIDPGTLLLRKQVYTSEAPGRPLIEERFSDYREIDGIQIPFAASRKLGPQIVERHATDIKINVPIDQAQFKRPAS
jgi:hypothetical protein